MSFDPVSYAMGLRAGSGTDVSDTTATAADVLSAKAFYLADGTKTQGSISSRAAQTYTPTTADQTIAAGQYLSGAQTVKGDANLVAGNIKKDVTIFGVTGSYEGGGGGGISLSGIAVTTPPTKMIYYDGDTFDAGGMVITATYSNGMSRAVTGYTVSPTTLVLGTTSVTVSYTEAGTTVTTQQAVTVRSATGGYIHDMTISANNGYGTYGTVSCTFDTYVSEPFTDTTVFLYWLYDEGHVDGASMLAAGGSIYYAYYSRYVDITGIYCVNRNTPELRARYSSGSLSFDPNNFTISDTVTQV